MRGEFIGVWSEMSPGIWRPLIERPFGERDDDLQEDIFCELYRELTKALRKPTGSAAVALLLTDAVALRELFDGAAQRGGRDLSVERVKDAFEQSGATEATGIESRRTLVESALTSLIEGPGTLLLDAQLQEHARDDAKVEAAWARAVERTINDKQASRDAFANTGAGELSGERAVVTFLESVHRTLQDFENPGDDTLTNRYFNLLAAFIEKFSLRYDLRRPCTVCPTLPGVFASLVRDLRLWAAKDAHLDELMKDFEESIRDLRIDCSDRRIKTCIQKQINFLEALGRTHPRVKRKTLGAISKQIASWPHEEVRTALQSLYGFTCDYPGIRHGGSRENALRAIDMRDLVAVSILLVGFTPYLSHSMSADLVYRGP